ncbi:hypothetical protein FB45DRAFT_1102323 [Roridomyces roridus]|uniref:F-box domain-containing protein n=1 Tax=Roridomyces roridus TaxID=1738132 RepID=A0AAD7CGJ3_9AGAR|nr:hypothetical protein FB45DRAFT_1102323 [Roridomyces roridus]
MHRGLCIPEIVYLIFSELRNLFPEPARDKTLAALAVTCRDFLNPALDTLWSEQTTLRHVLKCLPSHLWEQSVGSEPWDEGQFYLRLLGPVNPEYWSRPLFYASRIQKLTLDCSDTMHDAFPDASVLEAIRAGLPRTYLCPNLHNLLWRSDEDAQLPFLNLFLSPNLDSAAIMVFGVSPPVPLDLSILSLKKLDFQFPGNSSLVCRSASSLVLRLNRVEVLSVTNLDRTALQHLSQLETLRSLELFNVDAQHIGRLSSVVPRRAPFPALRTLKLGDVSYSGVNKILRMLPPSCELDSFTAGIQFHDPAMFNEVYTLLVESLSHATLRMLDIGFFSRTQEFPPSFERNTDLTTLFAFQNLQFLRVYSPVLLGIDDALAWDMARAWPNLTSLLLHSPLDDNLQDTPVLTLSGLRAFAVHCPCLTNLRIDVDASHVPADTITSSESSLSVLDVASSPIGDPDAVGSFVRQLFPHLEKIECQDWRWEHLGDMAPDRYLGWKQVEASLPHARDAEGEQEEEEDWELVDL